MSGSNQLESIEALNMRNHAICSGCSLSGKDVFGLSSEHTI